MAAEPMSGRHYAHPLISWGAVIAGVVVAVALGAALSILGVAIGAAAFNPFDMSAEQTTALTVGGGLWIAFANLVALQVGAYVAARAASHDDHYNGMLQGLMVWALAFVVALWLAGAGISMSATGLLSGAAEQPGMISEFVDDAESTAAQATDAAPADPATAEAADDAADATSVLAWWGFLTMALGAIGAIAGGRLGARHPAWESRPRHSFTVSAADIR